MTELKHIAIIMDGNNRWAKANSLSTKDGHKAGAEKAKEVIELAAKRGIKFLTLYAFSSENWTRPEDEVLGIKSLLQYYLSSEAKKLIEKGVKLNFIGDVSAFGADINEKCKEISSESKHHELISVNIALNYGSKQEITNAANLAYEKEGKITIEGINSNLYTSSFPDPDLLIRTGGEKRISNFLLWQLAYTELYFCDVLWPEFSSDDLDNAISDFNIRERRFGGR